MDKNLNEQIKKCIKEFAEDSQKGRDRIGSEYWFGRVCAAEELEKQITRILRK